MADKDFIGPVAWPLIVKLTELASYFFRFERACREASVPDMV
jgi:hypothetical protein